MPEKSNDSRTDAQIAAYHNARQREIEKAAEDAEERRQNERWRNPSYENLPHGYPSVD